MAILTDRHGRLRARRSATGLRLLGVTAIGAGAVLASGVVGLPDRPATKVTGAHAPTPVTATNLQSKPVNNSPQLVVDPTEKRFVVLANRLDGPDFSCALQVSGDGGRRWVTAQPARQLPEGAEKCYSPEVAFDRDGRLYYLFVGLAGRGNRPMGAFLTRSDDRARTFSPPRRVLDSNRYMIRMLLDPTMGERGRIHLVWLQAGADPPLGGLPATPNPIMASYSDDQGGTFTRPVQVSDTERRRVVAPAVALGADHAIHVLYYDLEEDSRDYQGLEGPKWEGSWSLILSTSADGLHFSRGVLVDGEVVPPERVMLIFTMPPPSLAADENGRVYAAWHDARNGDWDVFVRRSTDAGRSWARPQRANDDSVGNGRHQYLPKLSIAPGGRVDAIFYDRRGNVENRGNDVYYTYSTDHGESFAPNVKLTVLDSDSQIGPRYDVPSAAGLNEFGSRLALASKREEVLVAWTDTTNTGRGFPSQDIFGTRVELSTVDRSSITTQVAGGALLAAGLAALILSRRRAARQAQPTVAEI